MSARVNESSMDPVNSSYQETPAQNLSASGKVYDAVKGWFAFLTCGGIVYAASQTTAKFVDKYEQNCHCVLQSPPCTVYAASGVSFGIITIIALFGMLKLATGQWGASSTPIRNPSIIPNGSTFQPDSIQNCYPG